MARTALWLPLTLSLATFSLILGISAIQLAVLVGLGLAIEAPFLQMRNVKPNELISTGEVSGSQQRFRKTLWMSFWIPILAMLGFFIGANFELRTEFLDSLPFSLGDWPFLQHVVRPVLEFGDASRAAGVLGMHFASLIAVAVTLLISSRIVRRELHALMKAPVISRMRLLLTWLVVLFLSFTVLRSFSPNFQCDDRLSCWRMDSSIAPVLFYIGFAWAYSILIIGLWVCSLRRRLESLNIHQLPG